ncbi:trypsin-like peptidase domain-containing protein [Planococcus glaciei]|uniref:trypsin-like peptidase domain-containing protein n=1 Tax=Planococcus glaciei TaxID=459472 RepID=UPI001C73B098|nr:trypsin-like peptidase domain-containing protein [Planococcus glaciei]MBX0313370.1 trypsin-like peptidase domain-containing protein [Planococcus glaciei]
MLCEKCGQENESNANFCKSCGHSLRWKKGKNSKKNKWLAALILLVGIGGLGFGASQMDEEPSQKQKSETEVISSTDTKSNEGSTSEEINDKKDIETEGAPEAEVPEEPAKTGSPTEGTVTKVEDIVPPSEQPEKVEPKKKEKTAVIKETQQKVYTILTESGQGSGFLFDKSGLVATNAHVVAGFTDVVVRNINGQDQPGTVIGISDESDIALIKVDAFAGIDPLESEMNPTDVGTEVIALGSPSGFENTATLGYLTGIDRDFEQEFIYEDIYQIDAPIAPGSSGGPLVDAGTGKVIGINSLVMEEGDSIGFSIPMYSMHAMLTEWVNNPMTAEEVVAKFHVYDDFSSYEDENYEFDPDLELNFNETNLSEFIGDFRYYYEMALANEDFFYVQNLLVYESDIYNNILQYINEISGKGMEFNFNKLEITDIEVFEDYSLVNTEEAFDLKNAAGEWSLEERSKTYTIVMDENGFYYVSDIVNHE